MRAVRVGAVFLAFAFLSSSSSARTNRRGSGSEAAWEGIDALDDHRRALISDYIMAVEDAASERTKAEMATEDAAAAERAQAEIQELRQMMEELRRTVLTLGGAPPLQLATRTRALLASPTVTPTMDTQVSTLLCRVASQLLLPASTCRAYSRTAARPRSRPLALPGRLASLQYMHCSLII